MFNTTDFDKDRHIRFLVTDIFSNFNKTFHKYTIPLNHNGFIKY